MWKRLTVHKGMCNVHCRTVPNTVVVLADYKIENKRETYRPKIQNVLEVLINKADCLIQTRKFLVNECHHGHIRSDAILKFINSAYKISHPNYASCFNRHGKNLARVTELYLSAVWIFACEFYLFQNMHLLCFRCHSSVKVSILWKYLQTD